MCNLPSFLPIKNHQSGSSVDRYQSTEEHVICARVNTPILICNCRHTNHVMLAKCFTCVFPHRAPSLATLEGVTQRGITFCVGWSPNARDRTPFSSRLARESCQNLYGPKLPATYPFCTTFKVHSRTLDIPADIPELETLQPNLRLIGRAKANNSSARGRLVVATQGPIDRSAQQLKLRAG